jgi:hypothetical protein
MKAHDRICKMKKEILKISEIENYKRNLTDLKRTVQTTL